MLKRPFAALALLTAFACSSTTATEAPCTRPTGLWQLHAVERQGGTCGVLADGLVTFDEQADSSCQSVTNEWSADSCSWQSERKACQIRDSLGVSLGTQTTVTSLNETSATWWLGTIDVTRASCHSVYDATAMKQ